jgi:hypothetical protein
MLTESSNKSKLYTKCINGAVPWFQQLANGLSQRRTGFVHRLIHVGFVVDKVALGQDLL